MKTAENKKRIIRTAVLFLLFAILVSFVIWITWGNKALVLTEIQVSDERIPDGFSGYRIAQISDLHNTEFGKDNEKLLGLIEDAEPDIIVVTGDVIDARRTDVDVAVTFLEGAVNIAPCYYVTGNHEERMPVDTAVLTEKMEKIGVTVLDNEAVKLSCGSDEITLIGLPDYSYDDSALTDNLSRLVSDGYDVTLSHRPDHIYDYSCCKADLVLCGHVHGGQARLPFIGGLFGPGQGFFPEYSEGLYTVDDTSMIVSRGLGNSIFPFRINNRPEVVLVILERAED